MMSEDINVQIYRKYCIKFSQENNFVKQIYKMALVSGGEDVRLGETIQQDRVGDQRASRMCAPHIWPS